MDDARQSARRDRALSTGDSDPASAAAPPAPLLADSPAQAVPRMADASTQVGGRIRRVVAPFRIPNE
eukprot:4575907-Lingulodinium_polyedra.AAC.1